MNGTRDIRAVVLSAYANVGSLRWEMRISRGQLVGLGRENASDESGAFFHVSWWEFVVDLYGVFVGMECLTCQINDYEKN